MKFNYLFLLMFISSGLWAVDAGDLQGTWYRNYGVYRAWSDDNDGTVSQFEEDLIFHADKMVYIYDKSSDTYRGKSRYDIVKRQGKDFLVFYSPGQDPKNDEIQKEQGYFVSIKKDKDNHKELVLVTVKDYDKANNKDKARSTSYKRVRSSYKDATFLVPANKI